MGPNRKTIQRFMNHEPVAGSFMVATIRKLQEDDVDGICELWGQFARMRESQTQSRILNDDAADYFFGYATGLLHRKDTLTLVAADEGVLVGYLIAQQQRRPPIYHHTRVAYISDAFVAESHRKQGLLRNFINEVEKWAIREGVTALDVQIFKANELAQEVYRKMGFHDYRVLLRRELGP